VPTETTFDKILRIHFDEDRKALASRLTDAHQNL
jgi:hypothetical protein